MKYNGSKIALGIVLIILSFSTIGNVSFSSAEAIGYSIVPLGLIIGGIYLIIKGFKNKKEDMRKL